MGKWYDPLGNFLSHVVKGDCWKWTACKDKDGYGVGNLNQKKMAAHRVSWRLFRGDIPPGQLVLHNCHVRDCVNPDHLYLGTQRQNVQDQIDVGTFVKGEKNGCALLTDEIVREIRASEKSTRDLATQFNVSWYTIWDVKRNRSWKHIK